MNLSSVEPLAATVGTPLRSDHLNGRFIPGIVLLVAFWLVYRLMTLSKWVIAQF